MVARATRVVVAVLIDGRARLRVRTPRDTAHERSPGSPSSAESDARKIAAIRRIHWGMARRSI
jgi:hypothetical protein